MAFSSVWENVKLSNMLICIGKCSSKNIIIKYFMIMADVIAMLWADVLPFFFGFNWNFWQMLLPKLTIEYNWLILF